MTAWAHQPHRISHFPVLSAITQAPLPLSSILSRSSFFEHPGTRINDKQCSESPLGTLNGESFPVSPGPAPGGIYITGEVENVCAVIDTNEDGGSVSRVADREDL